jgi:rod shape determining protein RodA
VSATLARWWAGYRRRATLDLPLMAMLLGVCALGLIVLYSAGGADAGLVVKQALRFGIGFAALLVLAWLPPAALRRWSPWAYALGMLLLIAVAVLGEGRGAQRWLDLGLLRFQPSEILKLAVPMTLAAWLHERVLPPSLADLLVLGTLTAVPALLIIEQPDLGTALLVLAAAGFVIFLAGLSWRWIIGAGVALTAYAPVHWIWFMHDYQRQRVLTLLDPEADPLGSGWHILQSEIAVGSGGFAGKGWLEGTQSQLDFLPERHTDFILAVYGEEFGWLGVLLLFLLYFAIVARCLWIAMNARDTFGRLVAGSFGLSFFLYVLVNAGMISGLLPVVGVPLPFVSYGGTAAVVLLAGFGVVQSVHVHRRLVGS